MTDKIRFNGTDLDDFAQPIVADERMAELQRRYDEHVY